MISAGESSGELYGALLSREIKKRWPDTEITGIGGGRMRKEGVTLIASISHAFGITELIRHLWDLRNSFKKATAALRNERPQVLVLIDYPDFNIALAKRAKSLGIPVLYYVSPQVWAWRPSRVKKIASLVEKIAVLFPFEVDIYKNTGLPVEFVGHPIAETIDISEGREELKQRLGLNPHRPVAALLPGSRPSEIKRHTPLLKEVAAMIHNELPDFQIVIPLAPETQLTGEMPPYITVLNDVTREAIACSEVVAAASGTVTLEAALLGTPMVVFYKLAPLTFFFGKLLVKVNFVSLVNILSGKEVVVELIQKRATAQNIFSEIKRILRDDRYREEMLLNLNRIREIMWKKTASQRVASMVGELAGWKDTNAF